LFENVSFVRQGLDRQGLALPETPGPILAAKPTTRAAAKSIKQLLLSSGIYPPLISYPAGPPSNYFRFVISSEHTRPQLKNLVDVLGRCASLLTALD
jgi:7-keto-8-aminopelargonate synthetase-like enzyme